MTVIQGHDGLLMAYAAMSVLVFVLSTYLWSFILHLPKEINVFLIYFRFNPRISDGLLLFKYF